jgi:hypothetical protein
LSTFFQASSPSGATKNIWQEQLTLAKNSFYVKYDICRNFDKKDGPLESEPHRRRRTTVKLAKKVGCSAKERLGGA